MKIRFLVTLFITRIVNVVYQQYIACKLCNCISSEFGAAAKFCNKKLPRSSFERVFTFSSYQLNFLNFDFSFLIFQIIRRQSWIFFHHYFTRGRPYMTSRNFGQFLTFLRLPPSSHVLLLSPLYCCHKIFDPLPSPKTVTSFMDGLWRRMKIFYKDAFGLIFPNLNIEKNKLFAFT